MFGEIRNFFSNLSFDSLAGRNLETTWGDGRFIVYIVIFLGVLIAFEGLRQLLSRRENRSEAINRRMKLHAQGKSENEILDLLKPVQKKGFLGNIPLFGDLRSALVNVGSPMSPEFFAFFCGSGFLVTAGLSAQLASPLFAVALAAVLFLVLPLTILGSMNRKRKAQLVKQLPDALDLMSRGLLVGHPLNTSLQSVANEMPDPVGTEFGIVVDQVAYGDELTSAVNEMAERVDDEDVRYLAIAIGMQHGSGGDLANVLNTLARVIRSRSALRRKIKAITSEGRLTAYILTSLPVIIVVVMSIRTPTYYGDVMHFPSFWPIMASIGIAVVVNALVMFRLVNFRI